MKKLLFITVSLVIFNCTAQIISIEEANTYFVDEDAGLPDYVTAVKDLNNVLNPFLGNWQAQHNSYRYILEIRKIEVNTTSITYDILEIKYKVTNPNGIIVEDTTNSTNDFPVVEGSHFVDYNIGLYMCEYIGLKPFCGEQGGINLKIMDTDSNASNTMEFYFYNTPDVTNASECPNTLTFPFPNHTLLTFTKQ